MEAPRHHGRLRGGVQSEVRQDQGPGATVRRNGQEARGARSEDQGVGEQRSKGSAQIGERRRTHEDDGAAYGRVGTRARGGNEEAEGISIEWRRHGREEVAGARIRWAVDGGAHEL